MPAAGALPRVFVQAFFDKTIEGRIWPVMGTGCEVMLDGVVMDVVAESYEVLFVSDKVLPESALENAAATVAVT